MKKLFPKSVRQAIFDRCTAARLNDEDRALMHSCMSLSLCEDETLHEISMNRSYQSVLREMDRSVLAS